MLFGGGWSPPPKIKKVSIFEQKKNLFFFLFQKGSNLQKNMPNRLNQKKNQISDFSDFYFFELWLFFGHFCTQITPIFNELSR